jgi:hypothetical protein
MLTIFTTCRPFKDNFAVAQCNALTSWTYLQPRPEIILFGDEEGTAQITKELGIQHVPDVGRNSFGTPWVSSLFEQAQEIARNDTLAYVNADIILTSSFASATEMVANDVPKFLAVGQRWDLDVDRLIDFSDKDWETKLCLDAYQHGELHQKWGIDYFVFNRGLYHDIPPFVIGRPAWDNWAVRFAREQGVPVIDVTDVVTVIHQNHERSNWTGHEILQNRVLLMGKPLLGIQHATHKLRSD